MEIIFPNKHPKRNAAIKILKHNSFLGKSFTFSSSPKFLFKFVGNVFPMNAMLVGIVTLRNLPQRLEQFVITAFPPSPHGDQIYKETEFSPRDSEPYSNHLRLPMETGRVPQPSMVNYTILL